MRYTIAGGVTNNLSDRFGRNIRYILPLLVILLGVVYIGLHQTNHAGKPSKPLALGIYTIKTAGNTGSSGNNSGGTTPSTPTSSTSADSQIASAPAAIEPPASAPSPSDNSSLPVGGRGGGDGTTPAPGGVSAVGIVCTNLLTTEQLCGTCSPPVTLQFGQKAILYSDGTCVVAN